MLIFEKLTNTNSLNKEISQKFLNLRTIQKFSNITSTMTPESLNFDNFPMLFLHDHEIFVSDYNDLIKIFQKDFMKLITSRLSSERKILTWRCTCGKPSSLFDGTIFGNRKKPFFDMIEFI